jgi:hypothetical protein
MSLPWLFTKLISDFILPPPQLNLNYPLFSKNNPFGKKNLVKENPCASKSNASAHHISHMKTAFFAVQIENDGKKGLWGTLVSALIP